MSNIIDSSLALSSTNVTLVYTVTLACFWAEITISVVNPNTQTTSINIAVSANSTTTPNPDDYIEQGVVLTANGGVVSRSMKVAPGSKIFVKTSRAGAVTTVEGLSITKR